MLESAEEGMLKGDGENADMPKTSLRKEHSHAPAHW